MRKQARVHEQARCTPARRNRRHHGAVVSRQSLPLRRSPSTRLRNADKLRVCIVPKRASQPARIAFNGSARHRQRFHTENKVYYKKSMNIVMIDSLTSPVTEILGILAVLVAVLGQVLQREYALPGISHMLTTWHKFRTPGELGAI